MFPTPLWTRWVRACAGGWGNPATVSSEGCARTRLGKIKSSSSCAIVNSTWHGFAHSLLQNKELPCSSKHTASRGCGCRRSMCRPRHVFATTRGFARRVFASCLRTPSVFATTRVFARPVFTRCLRLPVCLRDGVGLGPTCLREVSSPAHVSSPDLSPAIVFSRAHGFTTGSALARAVRSGSVFGRPRVFAPRSVFAGNVSSDAHVLRCLRLACVC